MALHKKDFRSINPNSLIPLWNEFYPSKYSINEELFRMNTVDSSLFDWGSSSAVFDGTNPVAFVAIKKPAARLYRGPDPDTMHLNSIAFTDPEIAVDLIADVKQILRSRGSSQLVFGQDSRHFFPGCPDDAKQLKSFLMVEGFAEKGVAYDLERNLLNYENPAKETPGAEFRQLTEADRKSLLMFLDANFPGRWRHDVLDKASVEGLSNTIFGLIIDGMVQGFALVQNQTHKRPIGGAVWKSHLGENWGSLGPIGIANEVRGKGYGNRLLGEALDYLKETGVKCCIIDWTTLTDFYGKHGFKVTQEYHTMSLPLDS